MTKEHRLLLAGAGAGKTTYLVNQLLNTKEFSLITTFTIRNAEEIKTKIREINGGAIPSNIDIIPWDSFLIRHGIKPFIRCFAERKVRGLHWVNSQSEGAPRWAKSANIEYYLTPSGNVYSDKIANLACKCNDISSGMVIERLIKCYKNIFIDEAQDLAGYDFEFVKKLFEQNSAKVLLTCDPRQATYSTHFEKKNQKYNDGHIDQYIKDNCPNARCIIDNTTLNQSYRCCQEICSFSSKLYVGDYPEVISKASYKSTGHEGVFLIKPEDIEEYINNYPDIIQIRESRRTAVNEKCSVLNMGESKGTTFNRVLLYPTSDMLNWVCDNTVQMAPRTRSKFYVGLTRARYSVAIVCKDKKIYNRNIAGIQRWR